jgi:hypothetical protein
MKTIFGFIFLLLSTVPYQLIAQHLTYSVINFPKKLKINANAIVRDEEINIDIYSRDVVWITHKKVITILNPNGKYYGAIQVDYNKSRPVHSLSGALYDAYGQLIRKFKKKDFEDVSIIQDFSIFEDEREKRLFPSLSNYPYTVVYEYRQKYEFTLYLPRWIPVISSGISVQKSSYRVSAPKDIPIHYYTQQLQEPIIDSSDKEITYTWTLQNKLALKAEPYSPPLFKLNIPIVMVSPGQFKYYGMKGHFDNWKEYGKWVYEHLLKGRDELSESTINKIHKLTKGIPSDKEKAKILYAYAQKKNRYVSIQIGKGGFEPMEASEVDKVGYGDCKALVNYIRALFKIAGIPAYYTEVYGGNDKISLRPDFASAGQGNHIILCVPFGQDTTWLECTNKLMPFGYLGSFTDNRNVLVCTPEGGILTRTPKYPDSLNTQQRTAQFMIDSIGNLRGSMTTAFKGLLYQKRLPLEVFTYSDKLKRIKTIYSFLQMSVSKYDLSFMKKNNPVAVERCSFISRRYAGLGDNSLIIPLNPVNRFMDVPLMSKNRKNNIYISRGYVMSDSLSYIFPEGYEISLLPNEADIHSPFGSYTTKIKASENKLVYIRTFRLRSEYYPSDNYKQFVHFLQQIWGVDRQNFILKHI